MLQHRIDAIAMYLYRYWKEKFIAYYIIKAIMKKKHFGRIKTLNFVAFCALF